MQPNCVSQDRGSPDRVESDWMHDTARCLGYPSDSMRAARERDPGDNLQPACGPTCSPSRLDPRPRGSTIASWLNRRACAPTTATWAHAASSRPAAQLPALRIYSLTPGRRRRIATSHGPWAVCQGCSLPCQNEPGPNVAAAVIGVQREAGLGWHRGLRGLPARRMFSLSPGRRRRSATCQWLWTFSRDRPRAC